MSNVMETELKAQKITPDPDRDVLVRVEGVSKKFCRSLKKSLWYGVQDISGELLGRGSSETLRSDEFWAVKDVSFELRRGECLGLIGRNGAGKTTLLRMLNGLIKPDQGRIEMNGRVGGLIALGAGFNPILTGRENIYVNGSILGLSKAEIDARLEEIIDFAEIGNFIEAPVQTYSSGMGVRLGFAVAAVLIQPDVLLLDEVLAVGDASFQTKCINVVKRKISDGAGVIFVSHNMHDVLRYCNLGLYLNKGRVLKYGIIDDVSNLYLQDSNDDQVLKIQEPEFGNVPVSSHYSFGKLCAMDEDGVVVESLEFGKRVCFKIPIICSSTANPSFLVELVINDNIGVILRDISPEIALPIHPHNISSDLEITIPCLPLSSTYLLVGIALWSSDHTTMYAWTRNNRFNFDSSPSPGRLILSTNYKISPNS